ncbi:hypothetical protein [Pedobacter sp. Hv1]|uniref:hypothetical protein n=1 Tax=Pedobacter sp. Hv1 TaxID=1740090 RepID=UPI0006D8AAE5|nr:hypothetical protein [Pedobacter sp. Hv1]KQC00385.1 hypothetical protein AQF98_12940 [Pedobacter sp. Hv1]
MKNDEDLRIQEILDWRKIGNEDLSPEMTEMEDFKAYELIYDQLAKEPEAHLSISFKANVLRRVKLENKKASDRMFYWLLALVSLIGILIMVAIFFVFRDAFAPVLTVLDRFKGFILIGLAAVFVFYRVEKKLIRNH